MPSKFWKYQCCNEERWEAVAHCRKCGAPGVYDGWHYRMYEAMAIRQNRYGLKLGVPHWRLTDELFKESQVRCNVCDGRGLLDEGPGETYTCCIACKGEGQLWSLSPAEIDERRQLVLEVFPDAALNLKVDPTGPLVQNLLTGSIEQ